MKTLIIASVIFMAVTSVSAQTPDWVTGKSSMYPDDQYITGVGSGDTRLEAENSARAQLAEVFKVQLNARFTSNKTETLRGSNGNVNGESTDFTRSLVNVGLQKTLEGSEIADVWQNPKDLEYYALAVLNRRKASVRIADQITALDSDLVNAGRQLDTAKSKLAKLRILVSRKNIALKRKGLNSDYSILSSSGSGLPLPGTSADEASSDLLRFCQSEIVFGLNAKGEGSRSAAQVVSDGLTGEGLVVSGAEKREPDFTINIVSRMDPSNEPLDGWYYCRWDVDVNLVDNKTGVVMADISKRGRSGQLSVARSKDRAEYDMDKTVKEMVQELVRELMGEQG